MTRYWGLIPAAGVGQRMGAAIPKQFLKIGDKTLIERTMLALAEHDRIEGLCVGLPDVEEYGEHIKSVHSKVMDVFCGSDTRSGTVLNGIQHLINLGCSTDDWLLVHDANRPFLTKDEVTHLIESVGDDENGGIVGLPVIDTLKLSKEGSICKTMNRENCYRALTPQMFKLGLLHDALSQCMQQGIVVTDESQAMEKMGFRPKMVVGSSTNIKITTPSDLEFAKVMVKLQREHSG